MSAAGSTEGKFDREVEKKFRESMVNIRSLNTDKNWRLLR
jgi:hypothetical protein